MTRRSPWATAAFAAALILPLAGAGAVGFASSAPGPASGPPGPHGGPADPLTARHPSTHAPSTTFKDGPPARVTGGFGEDSCHACHFDGTENDPPGRFGVEGFPERYSPGETYPLELSLTRPGLAVAGFQLAVRSAEDEAQAGRLAVPAEEEGRVGILDDRGVLFAHHLVGGIDPAQPDTARWAVLWTAPEAGGGRVLLHAAGIAADGDDSQFGDHVHTLEAVAGPGEGAARQR